jgi:hypothetical protein
MNNLKYYTSLSKNRVAHLKPSNQWKPDVLINTLMNLQRHKKSINTVDVDKIWLGFNHTNNAHDYDLETMFKNIKYSYNLSNINNVATGTYISIWCLYDSNNNPTNQIDITLKKESYGINEGSYMIYDISYKKNYLSYVELKHLINELS